MVGNTRWIIPRVQIITVHSSSARSMMLLTGCTNYPAVNATEKQKPSFLEEEVKNNNVLLVSL